MVFASAQKNFGASGLVLVIVRKDLVEKSTNKTIPLIFDYKVQIANASMYNTPPTFPYGIKTHCFSLKKSISISLESTLPTKCSLGLKVKVV